MIERDGMVWNEAEPVSGEARRARSVGLRVAVGVRSPVVRRALTLARQRPGTRSARSETHESSSVIER